MWTPTVKERRKKLVHWNSLLSTLPRGAAPGVRCPSSQVSWALDVGFACNALLTLWSLWIFYLFFKIHFLHLLSTYYVLRLGDGEIRREWNKNSDKWTWKKKHLILPEKLRRASLKRWHLILKRWKILQGKEKGEGGERLQREGMDDMSENQVQELWWLFAELLSAEAEAGEAGGRLRKRTWSWR